MPLVSVMMARAALRLWVRAQSVILVKLGLGKLANLVCTGDRADLLYLLRMSQGHS